MYSFLILILLDVIFTFILSFSVRHKGAWITNLKNQKSDYIVLGNSRAFSAFDINTVEKFSGLKGVNLAVDAAGPVEMSIIYNYYVKHNEFDNVILLIDERVVNSKQFNKKAIKHFLPSMWTSYSDSFYSMQNKKNFEIPLRFYIPFYRYIEYSSEIGFREVVMTLFFNKNRFDKVGFKTINPKKKNDIAFKDKGINVNENTNNKVLINLITEITNDDKKLFKVNLPYYNEVTDELKSLNKQYNVIDYTNWHRNKSYFSDNVHLNKNGARIFSEQFAKDILKLRRDE